MSAITPVWTTPSSCAGAYTIGIEIVDLVLDFRCGVGGVCLLFCSCDHGQQSLSHGTDSLKSLSPGHKSSRPCEGAGAASPPLVAAARRLQGELAPCNLSLPCKGPVPVPGQHFCAGARPKSAATPWGTSGVRVGVLCVRTSLCLERGSPRGRQRLWQAPGCWRPERGV